MTVAVDDIAAGWSAAARSTRRFRLVATKVSPRRYEFCTRRRERSRELFGDAIHERADTDDADLH